MRTIDLNGEWQLFALENGSPTVEHPGQLIQLGLASIPALVPGNVELDLLRAGRIPGLEGSTTLDDLYRGENLRKVQQLETFEFWYQKEFTLPDDWQAAEAELLFEGVDCLAEYWLNGRKLGASENMFVEQRFAVGGALKKGVNRLCIRLRSALLEAAAKDYPASSLYLPTNIEQLFIRKAPHSYGWDIMPRALSAGLWRGVSLIAQDAPAIDEVYFYTRAADERSAWVGLRYHLRNCDWRGGELTLRARGICGENSFTTTRRVRFPSDGFEFAVEAPCLWWPLGYGDAALYDLTIDLLRGDEVLASRTEKVGIRQVELIRTEVTTINQPGEFLFKVNGTPILCKGSNHVPCHVFHSQDAARYAEIIALYVDAGCNIIRCWGGNVYEDHDFFARCDAAGLLVWQDFAMACAFHPQEADFLETMRAEAEAVVRKLRNHPSILLWSGDNEVDESMMGRGLNPANNQITRRVLPQVLASHDPFRPYLPSSPYYSPEAVASRDLNRMPERHLWGPRDYYKSDFFRAHTAHFVSEIGFHGCPNRSALERFLDADHLWHWKDNPQWIAHCTESIGADGPYAYRVALMAKQIAEMFGAIPETLDDFIFASQVSQAEAKKYFIEMTRLKKWRRTGLIWWNMIDGWPQFSDAVVDFYGGKKLAYYYIRRAQQPLHLMMGEPENWHIQLTAGADGRRDFRGTYTVREAGCAEALRAGAFHVGANQNQPLAEIPVSHGEQRLFLIEWQTEDGIRGGNHYLLGHPAFDLAQYRAWLKTIAALPLGFSADMIGR